MANFTILKEFIEKEQPTNLRDFHTEAEIDAMNGRSQQNAYDEAIALYRWWMTERHIEDQRVDDIFEASCETKVEAEKQKLVQEWLAARDAVHVKEGEMLIRLMKIRDSMWT